MRWGRKFKLIPIFLDSLTVGERCEEGYFPAQQLVLRGAGVVVEANSSRTDF